MDNCLWPILALENVTDDYLLFGLLYFLQLESFTGATIDPDTPIQSLFVEGHINDGDFTIAAVLHALHRGVKLDDEMLDFTLTTRQFVQMMAKLPTMSPEEFKEEHRKLAVGIRLHRDKN